MNYYTLLCLITLSLVQALDPKDPNVSCFYTKINIGDSTLTCVSAAATSVITVQPLVNTTVTTLPAPPAHNSTVFPTLTVSTPYESGYNSSAGSNSSSSSIKNNSSSSSSYGSSNSSTPLILTTLSNSFQANSSLNYTSPAVTVNTGGASSLASGAFLAGLMSFLLLL